MPARETPLGGPEQSPLGRSPSNRIYSSANHLLNFQHYNRDTRGRGGNDGRGRGGYRKPAARSMPYNRNKFLQANFRFLVSDAGNLKRHEADADLMLDWDDVLQVSLCHFAHCKHVVADLRRKAHASISLLNIVTSVARQSLHPHAAPIQSPSSCSSHTIFIFMQLPYHVHPHAAPKQSSMHRHAAAGKLEACSCCCIPCKMFTDYASHSLTKLSLILHKRPTHYNMLSSHSTTASTYVAAFIDISVEANNVATNVA